MIEFGFHGFKIRKNVTMNLRVVMLAFCKSKEKIENKIPAH